MSGGVDSSMTAYLLKEQGYEVNGVTMSLQLGLQSAAARRAQVIATKLGIPHRVVKFDSLFFRQIIEPFVAEYAQGKTPNPCINCNRHIKFGALLDATLEAGADYLATGHYARLESHADGFHLLKGIDAAKDQSYFLYTLTQRQLRHTFFPLGHLTKTEVKKMARKIGLDALIPSESQDICFIPDGNCGAFVARHIPPQPGTIVDTTGRVLGQHKGLIYYTVGQRQGLGLGGRGRLYVIRLDMNANQVVVGPHEQLFSHRLRANGLSWVAGHAPNALNNISARIRYKSSQAAVSMHLKKDTAEVCFEQPQWGVTPGQSIVFYAGEEVLGGGVIQASELTEKYESAKASSQAVFC